MRKISKKHAAHGDLVWPELQCRSVSEHNEHVGPYHLSAGVKAVDVHQATAYRSQVICRSYYDGGFSSLRRSMLRMALAAGSRACRPRGCWHKDPVQGLRRSISDRSDFDYGKVITDEFATQWPRTAMHPPLKRLQTTLSGVMSAR